MRRIVSLFSFLAVVLTRVATAHADPVAFVVNKDSDSVSVVDVNAGVAMGTFSTNGTPRATGQDPTDVIYDARSGRLFVSASGRLMSYDGRVPDGRGRVETAAQGQPSALALDDVGRRIFMSHEDLGFADGLVTEFSIADPLNPIAVAQHAVTGLPDLRFIAWDPKFARVYVMEDDGRIARSDSGPSNWRFAAVGGAGVTQPSGILADPNAGGVWLTGRNLGRMVRVTEAGVLSTTILAIGDQPRNLNWDPATPNTILYALEDRDEIKSFHAVTHLESVVLDTQNMPVDAMRIGTKVVSANRIGSGMTGSVSITGGLSAATEVKPVALAVADLPAFTASPTTATYCYNQAGDGAVKTFTVRNTRVNRLSANIMRPRSAGANPANYTVTSTGCDNVALAWGQSCSFDVTFRANPPSVEPPAPPSPIGGPSFRPATWPAEIVVESTNAPIVSVRIPVRAQLQLARCPGNPVVSWPLQPLFP